MDAADLGGLHDHVAGQLRGEEALHVRLAGEVELGVGAGEEIGEAQGNELAVDGGAHEATVPCDEHFRRPVRQERSKRPRVCDEDKEID